MHSFKKEISDWQNLGSLFWGLSEGKTRDLEEAEKIYAEIPNLGTDTKKFLAYIEICEKLIGKEFADELYSAACNALYSTEVKR
jgi:hypothetical protein